MGLQLAFGSTPFHLLVNCLPMGVMFTSNAVCVANVSVREDMALAILRQVEPLFEQVVLCLDPLFSKRLLDYAAEQSFDWSALRTNVIIGEKCSRKTTAVISPGACRWTSIAGRPDARQFHGRGGMASTCSSRFLKPSPCVARCIASPRILCCPPFLFQSLRTFVEVLAPARMVLATW